MRGARFQVEAASEWELFDVDTVQDLEALQAHMDIAELPP